MKTEKIIDDLNKYDNPVALGFRCQADDGQGNEYWVRGCTRLNRYDGGNVIVWDDDVSGWEEGK